MYDGAKKIIIYKLNNLTACSVCLFGVIIACFIFFFYFGFKCFSAGL